MKKSQITEKTSLLSPKENSKNFLSFNLFQFFLSSQFSLFLLFLLFLFIFFSFTSFISLYSNLYSNLFINHSNFHSGTQIYLKSFNNLYLKILSNSGEISFNYDSIFPYLMGSTLLIINDSNSCIYLKSRATNNWLSNKINSNIIEANEPLQENALCFNIINSSNSSYYIFQVKNKKKWLALNFIDNNYLTLIDSIPIQTSSTYFSKSSSIDENFHQYNHLFQLEIVPIIHGVNLGGWFIPEVWMNPSFYSGTGLGWGGSLCKLVNFSRPLAEKRMKDHLATWITEDDIIQIKSYHFNSVRIPIGYWNIISDPYHLYAPSNLELSYKYLDWIFDITKKYNLTVVIDLHGAPGSQNGVDHSGCSKIPTWTTSNNIQLTLNTVELILIRYSHRSNFLGIELLNEPGKLYEENSHDILEKFYRDSYHIIRRYHPTLYIIYNELYSNYYSSWNNIFMEPNYYNVVIDWHLYHWQEEYHYYTEQQHIDDVKKWKDLINNYSNWNQNPILIGEWSMSSGIYLQAGQEFVTETIKSFNNSWSIGWYVWNWKIDDTMKPGDLTIGQTNTNTNNNNNNNNNIERYSLYDPWNVKYQYHQTNGFRIPFN